ncbi:MAG: acyl-CoA dehydrogenase family protein [Pseudomonadales bacterium]|jgi:alkylation response protein AidB-like acyl-CoA dehydrogenase|nr:acyl-CoA dehydrogenase family protein [Pseudomonadales bacterium]MDG1444258.1 acyl-CoA dehydrogenase family protein [Pseudomonadales bacterium]
MTDLNTFREETREWLEANCPESMRNRSFHWEDAHEVYDTDEARSWLKVMAARGWTAPMWPKEYTGGGLSRDEAQILAQEMGRIKAIPASTGMGLSMIGPTLLEVGTEEQKQRHIPKIVSGEVSWCQGYSEPGAGSDLAALQCKAIIDGDNFVINGQKIWTSGAQHADWMFALVRTDFEASKHDGISFVLLDMHQPGVTIKPISLISGSSPFCETFLDDAIASREDLIGEMGKGWTVGKRLLQFERSGIGGMNGGGGKKKKPKKNEFVALAKQYTGESNGKIADAGAREEVLNHSMLERAFTLTAQRVGEENMSGKTLGTTTSIFKLVGANLARDGAELKSKLMGTQGIGWDGEGFSGLELETTKNWLSNRAVTIYGGTNEVQMNIIAKRVLALPE